MLLKSIPGILNVDMRSQGRGAPDDRLSRVDPFASALSGGRNTSGLLHTARMPRSGRVPVLRSFSVHFLTSLASRVGGNCSTEACTQTCVPISQFHG